MQLLPVGLNTVPLAGGGQRSDTMRLWKTLSPITCATFFDAEFPGERRKYGYFSQGYLPYHVTVPSPDGNERRVYHFDYYTGPREVVHYTNED